MSGLRLRAPGDSGALRAEPVGGPRALAGRVHLIGGALALTGWLLLSGAHLIGRETPGAVTPLLLVACGCAALVCASLLALPPSPRARDSATAVLPARPSVPASHAHRVRSRLAVEGRRLVLTDVTGARWWLTLDGEAGARRVAVLLHGPTPTELHVTTAYGETLLVLGWRQWFPSGDTGAARAFAAAAGLEYREGSRREAQVRDPDAPTARADGVGGGASHGGHLIALVGVSCFAPVSALVAASAGAPAPGALQVVGAATLAVVTTCTLLTVARLTRDHRTS